MAAATMYVTVAGAGGKTGADWANAMSITEWRTDILSNAEAGDIYYLLSGTYTSPGNLLTTRGGTTTAPIRMIGVSDQAVPPTIATGDDCPLIVNGAYYLICNAANWAVEHLLFTGTVATYGAFCYAINGAGIDCSFVNDSASAGRPALATLGVPTVVHDCYAKSTNGTAFPSSYGTIVRCYAQDSSVGIATHGLSSVSHSITDTCVTGISITAVITNVYTLINHNTIYGATTGINLNSQTLAEIINNIIDTCTTGITSGAAFGTVRADYNNFNGNGTDRTNVTAGAHDTASNPQFVNAAAGDFTLTAGSSCLTAGMPISLGVATPVTTHQGAVPPVAGGGGGGMLVNPGTSGGARG